jgi:hypothetical protein
MVFVGVNVGELVGVDVNVGVLVVVGVCVGNDEQLVIPHK